MTRSVTRRGKTSSTGRPPRTRRMLEMSYSPALGRPGKVRTSGSGEGMASAPVRGSDTTPASPGPVSSAWTSNGPPRRRLTSLDESIRPPALTTMRTPAAVCFGTIGLAGSTPALTP